jgi:hypothetical protein
MSKKRAKEPEWDLVKGPDIYPYADGYGFLNNEYIKIHNFLEVRESNIPGAGNGLFATKKLKKGTKLGFYSGKLLTKEEHKKMSAEEAAYVVTIHWKRKVNGKRQYIIIDGNVSGNKLKMLNDGAHSGGVPNVDMDDGGFMYTTQDVEAGEELLWNYGTKYWDTSLPSSESRSPTHTSDESASEPSEESEEYRPKRSRKSKSKKKARARTRRPAGPSSRASRAPSAAGPSAAGPSAAGPSRSTSSSDLVFMEVRKPPEVFYVDSD